MFKVCSVIFKSTFSDIVQHYQIDTKQSKEGEEHQLHHHLHHLVGNIHDQDVSPIVTTYFCNIVVKHEVVFFKYI